MNILKQIVADLLPRLEEKKREIPLPELQKKISRLPPSPDFASVFRPDRTNIIAELKKASPSKGIIRANFNARECALELQAAGAAALSVLTESNYFHGSMDYLRKVAGVVKIPLLCKDFIVDPYQIWEARLNGAAAVLLIAALLPPDELQRLAAAAAEAGLSVLGEAHDEKELAVLLDGGIRLIGINARNLKTFACDLERVEQLLKYVPADRIAIAESSIQNRMELLSLQRAGARGFLIGETLMRAENPGEKLKELL